ncbi:hypothetical protein C8J56DRAFT_896077 [Mycena floridula]|nr:hypothetical protein C8J56DRAFT_896077 [Mycena floridula]
MSQGPSPGASVTKGLGPDSPPYRVFSSLCRQWSNLNSVISLPAVYKTNAGGDRHNGIFGKCVANLCCFDIVFPKAPRRAYYQEFRPSDLDIGPVPAIEHALDEPARRLVFFINIVDEICALDPRTPELLTMTQGKRHVWPFLPPSEVKRPAKHERGAISMWSHRVNADNSRQKTDAIWERRGMGEVGWLLMTKGVLVRLSGPSLKVGQRPRHISHLLPLPLPNKQFTPAVPGKAEQTVVWP